MALAYYFLKDNPQEIFDTIKNSNKIWLTISAFTILIYWLLEAVCLHIIVKKLYKKQTFHETLSVSMIGQLFNCITPFASGGQPIQAFYMTKGGLSLGMATSALLSKFIIYQTILTIFSAMELIFYFGHFTASVAGFGLLVLFGFAVNAVIVVFLLLLAFFPNISQRIVCFFIRMLSKIKIIKNKEKTYAYFDDEFEQFRQSFVIIKENIPAIFYMSIFTILQLIVFFVIPFVVSMALNIANNDPAEMIAASSFVLLISSFVPLPGATGGAEGSFYLFFNDFFTINSNSTTNVAVILWRLITFYLPIIIGGLFLFFANKRLKTKSAETTK